MRPRSWCSWARPKRSGLWITIAVALGTSTPTSTTVVATSTGASPDVNAAITACLSFAFIFPCSSSTRVPGKTSCCRRSCSTVAAFRSCPSVSSMTG